MRLVFVHGINNQGRSESKIIDAWLGALSHALSPSDLATLRRAEIVAPFYGDVLHAATVRASSAGQQAVAMAAGQPASDEARFYREALQDLAPATGVTARDVATQARPGEPIELGLFDDRRLLRVVRALEQVSPFQGPLILRFLPQAFVDLHRAAVTADIDDIVRPAITGQPCIVVGHSLGSVVTYKLLRGGGGTVPLYLTIGSPLAVAAVKNGIGPAFERPSGVARWLNGIDVDDAVTVGRVLSDVTFGPDIENIDDFDNGPNAHDAVMYLRDRRVGEALLRSLTG